MNSLASKSLTVFALAGLAVCAGVAVSGPLDPPAGGVASTFKTLGEIEPRIAINAANTPGNAASLHRITQPGSYYLTGNLDAPNNLAAIEVAADNVTIDLNGFSVMRSATGASARSLIVLASNFVAGTTVLNGSVVNSGHHGVELGSNAHVERLRVVEPAGRGISLYSGGRVADCTVQLSGQAGVYVQGDSVVSRTIVENARAEGIVALGSSIISECTVGYADGIGIEVGIDTVVERCVVSGGDSWGISAALNTPAQVFRNNIVYMNDGGAIRVYFAALVEGNRCDSSNFSVPNIYAIEDRNRVRENHCTGGTDAVRLGAGAIDNLITENFSVNASVGSGFANVPLANNQLGPVVSASGTIATNSPWANFSR